MRVVIRFGRIAKQTDEGRTEPADAGLRLEPLVPMTLAVEKGDEPEAPPLAAVPAAQAFRPMDLMPALPLTPALAMASDAGAPKVALQEPVLTVPELPEPVAVEPQPIPVPAPELVTPQAPQRPVKTPQPKIRCNRCGSADTWRFGRVKGIRLAMASFAKGQWLTCRGCGHRFLTRQLGAMTEDSDEEYE